MRDKNHRPRLRSSHAADFVKRVGPKIYDDYKDEPVIFAGIGNSGNFFGYQLTTFAVQNGMDATYINIDKGTVRRDLQKNRGAIRGRALVFVDDAVWTATTYNQVLDVAREMSERLGYTGVKFAVWIDSKNIADYHGRSEEPRGVKDYMAGFIRGLRGR
ncbi:MAG: hypothetical protein J4431_00585 [Candidatus Aenigmarchaeota archaeon]|nr:hypothetical protein [Candidatus Aenigmarchaeota archaeon]